MVHIYTVRFCPLKMVERKEKKPEDFCPFHLFFFFFLRGTSTDLIAFLLPLLPLLFTSIVLPLFVRVLLWRIFDWHKTYWRDYMMMNVRSSLAKIWHGLFFLAFGELVGIYVSEPFETLYDVHLHWTSVSALICDLNLILMLPDYWRAKPFKLYFLL